LVSPNFGCLGGNWTFSTPTGVYTNNSVTGEMASRVENRRSGFSLPVAVGVLSHGPPQSGWAWPCFLFPLIEPDWQISRIRLSEKTHASLIRKRVTPSAPSEHNLRVARLIVNPHVLRCFLRPSLTEAPSLHRSYPASSVLRTSPPPHTARPVSRELPVDPYRDHRWGFPCCVWSPLRTCHRHYPGRFHGACSLVSLHRLRPSLCNSQVGSCNCFFGACSAFTHVMACTLAESPSDPLHRKLRQLRCLRCRFDCYRVERTSSRAGVAPAEVQRLSRRTVTTAIQE